MTSRLHELLEEAVPAAPPAPTRVIDARAEQLRHRRRTTNRLVVMLSVGVLAVALALPQRGPSIVFDGGPPDGHPQIMEPPAPTLPAPMDVPVVAPGEVPTFSAGTGVGDGATNPTVSMNSPVPSGSRAPASPRAAPASPASSATLQPAEAAAADEVDRTDPEAVAMAWLTALQQEDRTTLLAFSRPGWEESGHVIDEDVDVRALRLSFSHRPLPVFTDLQVIGTQPLEPNGTLELSTRVDIRARHARFSVYVVDGLVVDADMTVPTGPTGHLEMVVRGEGTICAFEVLTPGDTASQVTSYSAGPDRCSELVRFTLLTAGTYEIYVKQDGQLRATPIVTIRPNQTARVEVDLRAGATPTPDPASSP